MKLELRLNEDLEQLDIFYGENESNQYMIGSVYDNEDGEKVVSLAEDVSVETLQRLSDLLLKYSPKTETVSHEEIAKNLNSVRDSLFPKEMGSSYQDCY